MSSLTEFEKLEKECTEAIQDSNKTGGEDIMMLSEIEEGLESQCSDVIEILQESLHEGSDSSEYERRRIDIEESDQSSTMQCREIPRRNGFGRGHFG
ncbi:uncharacterized protein TNCT_157831 [Trichonephila clavata]|uniref:Uncharacterized protein n=1 Tax=Trichonephila clavata TaxID=2740835 RepID=A0A8X6HL15_TRICU|nr:uncharacterized protein TNCT_157831 [Trichonephila clavata]